METKNEQFSSLFDSCEEAYQALRGMYIRSIYCNINKSHWHEMDCEDLGLIDLLMRKEGDHCSTLAKYLLDRVIAKNGKLIFRGYEWDNDADEPIFHDVPAKNVDINTLRQIEEFARTINF